MSTFRGSKGQLALGGLQAGSPQLQGAVSQGATQATLDGGGGGLNGVILEGDEFTVAGDGNTYTVTADAVISSNSVTISFTPSVQVSAGWADNAAVTFTANSIAQVRRWEASPSREYLRTDTMGDNARTGTLDMPQWSGSAQALFDYSDPQQKSFVDEVKGNAAPSDVGMALQVAADPQKQLYGHIVAPQATVTAEKGSLVTIEFTFEGEGQIAANWNT